MNAITEGGVFAKCSFNLGVTRGTLGVSGSTESDRFPYTATGFEEAYVRPHF